MRWTISAYWAFILFMISVHDNVHASQPPTRTVAAPPLRECKVTPTNDLGLWDDVFVAHDQDFMILRRDDDLFSLAMKGSSTPTRIAKTPEVSNTRILNAASIDNKLWLFFYSSKAVPCMFEVNHGAIVKFEHPNLTASTKYDPENQSCIIVPTAKAAILRISGYRNPKGDDVTTVYYWFDLKSGKVIRFPLDWYLSYFSADENFVAFSTADRSAFGISILQTIDMKSGEKTTVWPDDSTRNCIPHGWGNKDRREKPLYSWKAGEASPGEFAGLSVEGLVLPTTLDFGKYRYLSMAKAGDGFAGFRLRQNGGGDADPSPLWIVPFKEPQKTESIATGVTDFAMLGDGNVMYATVKPGDNHGPPELRRHADVSFFNRPEKVSWNVLDGVERLPKLEREHAKSKSVEDSVTAQFVEGFGTKRYATLVLCLVEHRRYDRDSRPRMINDKGLKGETWRCTLAVEHDGQRSLVPLFRTGNLPDQFWMHKSGKLITGTHIWQGPISERTRQIQLSECTLVRP